MKKKRELKSNIVANGILSSMLGMDRIGVKRKSIYKLGSNF